MLPVARKLREAGKPDGSVVFVTNGRAIDVENVTLYSLSEYTAPEKMIGSLPAEEALAADVSEAATNQAPVAPKTATFTLAMFNALVALNNDGGAWATFGGKMKGMLNNGGYVTIASKSYATLTDAGKEATKVAPASVDAPLWVIVKQASGETRMVVTPRQRDALAMVQNGDFNAWNDLHGKTRNMMVSDRWVTGGDKPVLTDFGKAIIQAVSVATGGAN